MQHYPRIRKRWSAWGFDGSTRIGRLIWCICAREEVQVVLDLFTHIGSGGGLTVAHALESKGIRREAAITVERDQENCEIARQNLMGYDTARLICRDAVEVVPDICREQPVDLIIFDLQRFGPGFEGFRKKLFAVVAGCRPLWWIFNNVQHESLYQGLLDVLMEDGQHELVLHDFSPTLIADGRQGVMQEFLVLRSLHPIRTS